MELRITSYNVCYTKLLRLIGEGIDVQAQGAGEIVQEAAAARGTGLVQLDGGDGAVLHAEALHVLAADIEKEFHAGNEEIGGAVVRDGFDFPGVDAEGGLKEGLSVTGGSYNFV